MVGLNENQRAALRRQMPILNYFEYNHLPTNLQEVSAMVCETAWRMAEILPVNAELTAGLRKLLEAKDCFVRARLG